jgi:integrase
VDPDGNEFPPDAYVFGDAVGQRVKSVRTAWKNATEAAGLDGLQLRDLRHEAGSRFDEAGVPISYTSKILGHSNLNTTSR